MLLRTCLGTGEATLAPRCPSCMNPQPEKCSSTESFPHGYFWTLHPNFTCGPGGSRLLWLEVHPQCIPWSGT